MTSEPKTSHNGNRPRISWPVAKAYWLALPEEKRTYQAVADRFNVSAERVGQIARRDNWAEDADRVRVEQERALYREVRRTVRSRADRIARTLDFFDRANDLAIASLPIDANGEIDLTKLGEARPKIEALLSSMPGLFKMAELAAGEATDRVAIAEVQPVLVAFAKIAVVNAPADRRGEVMAELEQASAGLVELGAPAAA